MTVQSAQEPLTAPTASVFSWPFENVRDEAEMPGFVCPAAEQKDIFT